MYPTPAHALADPFMRIQVAPLPMNPGGPFGLQRVHGDYTCTTCGGAARAHPRDWAAVDSEGRPFLYVLCDGTRAKL
jgi:hypothetical protein